MLTVALSTMVRRSMTENRQRNYGIYTTEYYAAHQFTPKWIELVGSMLSKSEEKGEIWDALTYL